MKTINFAVYAALGLTLNGSRALITRGGKRY